MIPHTSTYALLDQNKNQCVIKIELEQSRSDIVKCRIWGVVTHIGPVRDVKPTRPITFARTVSFVMYVQHIKSTAKGACACWLTLSLSGGTRWIYIIISKHHFHGA